MVSKFRFGESEKNFLQSDFQEAHQSGHSRASSGFQGSQSSLSANPLVVKSSQTSVLPPLTLKDLSFRPLCSLSSLCPPQ